MIHGTTPIITHYLNKGMSVIYLCQTQPVREHLFHRAYNHFQAGTTRVDGKATQLFFGKTFLRFTSLNQNTEAFLKGKKAVVVQHPELVFEHGYHESLVENIKYMNMRYADGNTQ